MPDHLINLSTLCDKNVACSEAENFQRVTKRLYYFSLPS